MFEGITRGLSDALKKLKGRGRLSADNIREGLREVRRALLEADVNFTVVTNFIAKVEEKAVGQDVLARVDPSEQIVKIVYEELCGLMGPVDHKIPQRGDRPVILMLCGLQGSGKTTTAAKLAVTLKRLSRRGDLVAGRRHEIPDLGEDHVAGEQRVAAVSVEPRAFFCGGELIDAVKRVGQRSARCGNCGVESQQLFAEGVELGGSAGRPEGQPLARGHIGMQAGP